MAVHASAVASPTAAVAEWVATTPSSVIPDDVREAARWLILDHLGCSIGGSQLQPGRILLEFYREQGGTPQATIYASGEQTSLLNACYVNSALSNLLDFDDTYTSIAHPAGTVVSPALVVAEHTGKSMDDVVSAVIFAYEVMLRLGLAAKPSADRYRLVHGLGTFQTIGAVVAAGYLLELTADQMLHALGLGLVNSPVPNMRKLGLEPAERPFSWSKNNYGWASQGGLLGALLAERGFLGVTSILDGERGFWRMIGSDQWQPEQLTAGLGEEWMLPGTGFKPYASCRWTHTALDAGRELRASQPDITPDLIQRIELASFFEVAEKLSEPDPTDIIDAQFSVRHVMALELLGRSPRYGLTEEDLTDPDVVALRQRIELVEDPELTRRYLSERKIPARLTVEMTDGKRRQIEVDHPWGDPENPFVHDDILAKYEALTSPVVGPDRSARIRDAVLGANGSGSIREVFAR